MKICVECKWCHAVNRSDLPQSYASYYCHNPIVDAVENIDPVTGLNRIDHGGGALCKLVNIDGNCELYEAK